MINHTEQGLNNLLDVTYDQDYPDIIDKISRIKTLSDSDYRLALLIIGLHSSNKEAAVLHMSLRNGLPIRREILKMLCTL